MTPESDLLKEVPLFTLLDDHERAELAAQLDVVHFTAGEIVFNYGDPGESIYVISAIMALYLNVFVGVTQAFQKLSFLQPLAPTQSEPPFLIAQIAVLLLFIVLGVLAVRRFHPASA